jgi:hypothetical protein
MFDGNCARSAGLMETTSNPGTGAAVKVTISITMTISRQVIVLAD